jgi:ATP-dependent Clp protease ATP-binding subunit ClpC
MMGLTDFNLTPKAKNGLKDAQKFAEANGHSLVTTAHLVYGCLMNISDSCVLKLKAYGVILDSKKFVETFKEYAAKNKKAFQTKKGQGGWHDDLNEIIFFAKEFSDNFDSFFVGVEHILYVILDMEGPFVEHLRQSGVDTLHAKDIIENHVLETNIPPTDQIKNILHIEGKKFPTPQEGESPRPRPLPHLSRYCINLNQDFLINRASKISGRDTEINELIEILSKKNKSNAILVGEAGVGKTAIVEGLAQQIVNQESPAHMSLMQICAVDISALVAGTKYRGEFEERFKSLIAEAEKEPNIILFFDEIHTIIGAGNSEGSVDASNMLKPALARGSIKCIGATTSQEYKKFFEKDSAMKRRFDKIVVEEPSKSETKKIVMNALPFYEDFHHVKYQESDIDSILDFSDKFLSDKRFPDKAFDIVDQLGAKTKIKYSSTPPKVESARDEFCKFLVNTEKNHDLDEEKFTQLLKGYLATMVNFGRYKGRRQKIRQKDIVAVITEKTGLSPKAVSQNHSSFAAFSRQMNNEVFGQEENINIIYNALACAKAGLTDPRKPLSNFLFIGGTSVGKTFTAKKMAKHFFGNEQAFIQLNMSEYQDKTGISKLIGANAGYVGYEEGGLLTEFVRNKPNSVVLFDEIEKCDPKILDVLLHILDEGYATDNLNRTIDFTRTIIVMTSNIGHEEKSKRSMGFLPQQERDSTLYKKSLKKHLRPELLARLDEILFFNELEEGHLLKIITQELFNIEERLLSRNITLKCDNTVKKYIFNEIKEKNSHARQIKNLVKGLIQVPLSKFIVKNRKIEKISLKMVDNALTFA